MHRFDVVVLNHARLNLFFENFDRIRGFDPGQDRLTVLSCSPSPQERALVAAFEQRRQIPVRYLTRRNRGIDQLARVDYFLGTAGALDENLDARWTWQMQEHYLAPDDPSSCWGPELDYAVKGDVVPDGVVFDLAELDRRGRHENVDGMWADRNRPSYVELDGRRFVAPNGGNFIVATHHIRDPSVQDACRRLDRCCDGSYAWAVYAEYAWARLFFPEGRRFLDIATGQVWDGWPREAFYATPDDYTALTRRYESSSWVRAALGAEDRLRTAAHRLAARLRSAPR